MSPKCDRASCNGPLSSTEPAAMDPWTLQDSRRASRKKPLNPTKPASITEPVPATSTRTPRPDCCPAPAPFRGGAGRGRVAAERSEAGTPAPWWRSGRFVTPMRTTTSRWPPTTSTAPGGWVGSGGAALAPTRLRPSPGRPPCCSGREGKGPVPAAEPSSQEPAWCCGTQAFIADTCRLKNHPVP